MCLTHLAISAIMSFDSNPHTFFTLFLIFSLAEQLTLMEDHCQEEESALGSSKALLAQLEAQNTRMAYNLEHLPERVPGFAKAPQIAAASAAADGQPQPAPAPGAPSQSGALKPNNKQTGGAVKPKAKGKGKAASGPAIPTPPVMAYVRADEFEGVPKYVRGRLTQADVNRVVDGFQAALNEKYRILALPRPQLNDMVSGGGSKFWIRVGGWITFRSFYVLSLGFDGSWFDRPSELCFFSSSGRIIASPDCQPLSGAEPRQDRGHRICYR